MNKIGINVHGANVQNKGRLMERLSAIRPPVVLVLDSLGLAQDIKTKLPDTTVIFREYEHDKKIHLDFNPVTWLDNHASQAAGGIVIHVGNEMQFDKAVLDWLLNVCKRAVEKNVTVCVGNWAVGNPQPDDWAMAKDLLVFASANRKHVIVGLHEYAGGVITSGLYGGYPDNAGKPPGTPGGLNLIQPDSWPPDISTITCYHMARYKFLLTYCKKMGIPAPRIVITEAGFDDTSDIKSWEETLKKTPPYLNITGYKSLRNQWDVWFGELGWSAERSYASQMIYSDRVYYDDDAVEGRCIFCYAHSSTRWEAWDTEDATEFWDLIIKYAQEAVPVSTLPLPNDARWTDATNHSGDSYRVRLQPFVDDAVQLAWIEAGDRFHYIPGVLTNEFLYVKTLAGLVGYSHRDILSVEPPIVLPPIELPPDDDDPEPPTTPGEPSEREKWDLQAKRLYTEYAELHLELSGINKRLAIVEASLAELFDKDREIIRNERLANVA